MIGVPVGPGDGDVGDLLQDRPQPVRIYSIPAHGGAREFQICRPRLPPLRRGDVASSASATIDSHFITAGKVNAMSNGVL